MAKVETVTLIDDVDGTAAEETVQFGYQGRDLEIDLSKGNAAKLRELLAPFVDKARVVRGKRGGSSSAAKASATDREETRVIRAWARDHGYPDMSDRGRIPMEIRQAYQDRWSGTASVTPIRPATVEEAKATKAEPPAPVAADKPKAPKKATKAGLPKVEPKPVGVKVQAMSGMQVTAVENFKLPTHTVAKSFVIFDADSPAEVLGKIRAALQDYDGPKNSGDYAAMKAVIRALELADPKKVKVVEVAA